MRLLDQSLDPDYEDGHYNNQQFMDHITERSESDDYKIAVKEWYDIHVTDDDEPTCCPCGHHIVDRCYIRNRINGNETFVGNVCIGKFLGITKTKVISGIKRLRKERTANANEPLIDHSSEHGYLFEGEVDFLMERRRKKHENLPIVERVKKLNINNRILKRTVVNPNEDD